MAIAEKMTAHETDDPYNELILLGVVGLEDPAREGVREAIERCHNAGVAVVMVTGDHAATARNIGAGLAIGAGIGTALFAATNNPVWIAVGAALGAAIGQLGPKGGEDTPEE